MKCRQLFLSTLAICSVLHNAQGAPSMNTPTTQMISVDDHKLAFHVTQGKTPIIVLDAGGGEDSSYWKSFAPRLAHRTGFKVITYDRSGFGASEVVNGPWNVQTATDDLEHGLEQLKATHDLILVSHSLAGEIATYLVQRHPEWFRGAVLVDATVPDFFTDDTIARQIAGYAPIVAAARKAPPSPQTRQLLAVADSYESTSKAFHQASWPSSVPVVVIVSSKTPFDSASDAQLWRDAQTAFAAKAPNRTLVVAEHSSHDIPRDRPEVVLKAIEMLAAPGP
jgi:pimeloyl-ACP methyl ester carboxylesterase